MSLGGFIVRILIVLIILLLLAWRYWPDPEPIPVEETFIGEPVKRLHESQQFEQQYLEAVEARKAEMEKQLEEQAGGG